MIPVLVAAVAAVTLGGCLWPSPGQGPDNASFNSVEKSITAANVSALSTAWTATVDDGGGDVLYASTSTGQLPAFPPVGCGASTCSPLWSTNLSSALSSPIVSGGQLYVGTADSRMVAYKLATG